VQLPIWSTTTTKSQIGIISTILILYVVYQSCKRILRILSNLLVNIMSKCCSKSILYLHKLRIKNQNVLLETGGIKMQECKNAISHSLNAICLVRECVLLLRKTNSKTHSLTELFIVVKCLVLFFPTIPQRCDKMINVGLQ
jgi:hypothetical protein